MSPTDAAYTLPIQRVWAMIDIAARRGWDVESLLADTGLSPEVLAEGRSRVTNDQIARLVRQLWLITDDELLGFGLRPVPRGTFQLVCFALISTDTLRVGIERFLAFQRSLPGFPGLTLTETGGEARLSFDISAVERPVELLIDTMLAVTHRFFGWAVGGRIPLRRVEVPYPADPDVDDYDAIFAAPVAFSAPLPALVFDTAALDAPIVRTEDDLAAFLNDSATLIFTQSDFSVTLAAEVRRILERGLTGDWPDVDTIAAELTMSPQTLRRKLHDEGTSAREIRENILRDAAISALVRGNETVAALSRRLGFSEPSAFSRAFRRWTGSAPGSYQH